MELNIEPITVYIKHSRNLGGSRELNENWYTSDSNFTISTAGGKTNWTSDGEVKGKFTSEGEVEGKTKTITGLKA
jgi:hypothetical protein